MTGRMKGQAFISFPGTVHLCRVNTPYAGHETLKQCQGSLVTINQRKPRSVLDSLYMSGFLTVLNLQIKWQLSVHHLWKTSGEPLAYTAEFFFQKIMILRIWKKNFTLAQFQRNSLSCREIHVHQLSLLIIIDMLLLVQNLSRICEVDALQMLF